jgi:hypothetical protein
LEARHLIEVLLEARKKGFTLRSVEDDSTFESLLMAVVMGDRNHEDSRRKSEATKAGLARRRAKGKILGKRSLGYRFERRSIDDDEKITVVHPTEAAAIRRIFAAFRAGQSQLGIARDLVTDGVRTVNGGAQWYQGGIRRILTNPVYAGLVRDGDELIEGEHEAIIPREEWQAVQDLIDVKPGAFKKEGRPPLGKHLFRAGHLRCSCGGAMVPRTEGERQTYRCNRRARDSTTCSMPEIPRALVDGKVFAYFRNVALDEEATRKQLSEARDRKLSEVGAHLAAAEREAIEAAEAIERIERDYTRGKMDIEDWQRLRAKLAAEHDGAVAARDRLRDQFAEVEADADFLDIETSVADELRHLSEVISREIESADGIEAVRVVLLRLFDRFILRRRGELAPRPAGEVVERGPQIDDVLLDDLEETERWIEPVPNWQAVEGTDENFLPVLTREPLGKAGNKYALTRVSA